MNPNRRQFIKRFSIVSASLIPVSAALSSQLKMDDQEECQKLLEQSFNENLQFHLLDNNLLNLRFYFINTKRRRHDILPIDFNSPSFMIVRLPQMHVSEQGFWVKDWSAGIRKTSPAKLSGFSYLAFELWPTSTTLSLNKQKKIRKFRFTLENILDWNNQCYYDLVTLVEWFKLKGVEEREFTLSNNLDDIKNNHTWNENTVNTGNYQETTEPKTADFRKYKSIVSTLLDRNLRKPGTQKYFVPITFFEVPQASVLVPIMRDAAGKLMEPQKKGFWSNKFKNQSKSDGGYRKYEVWNNTLFYTKKLDSESNNPASIFSIETPSFRIFGIMANQDDLQPSKDDPCTIDCNKDTQKNALPSLLDKAELTLLTQWANDEANKQDHRNTEFDIKELNGFFFTGLGIITHLKYYNVENKPANVDLIEYEHIIVEGRDVLIKVSRLGYNCKTGQRYKHVIEGKRRIKMPTDKDDAPLFSFIELKQYCECIDFCIDYLQENDTWKVADFPLLKPTPAVPNQADVLFAPVLTNVCHFRRNTYTKLTVEEKKRIPIDCLTDSIIPQVICDLENAMYFWPVKEGLQLEKTSGIQIPLDNYLNCEFTGYDHEDNKVSGETPFMFIRSCIIEQNDLGQLQAIQNLYFSNECPTYTERRKTYYNNQKIAYTPSLKSEKIQQTTVPSAIIDTNTSNSKINILETEFVDSYFCIRNITQQVNVDKTPIGKIKNVVYPQVLRAKVFVDHVKDLTQKKIPSILDYHDDYIADGFKEFYTENNILKGNGAKVILKNTLAFATGKEEDLNNSYKQISNAIQDAKDKIGNLVVPDINPESLSLEKLGITAPPGIKDSISNGKALLNGAQKIMAFNPRELLRGKLSNVCGLDLSSILDELLPAGDDDNQTPLFQINKLLNKMEGGILQSPIYAKITSFKITDPFDGEKLAPDKMVEKYEKKIAALTKTIEDKRTELNSALRMLADIIPNADQLNNLVKNLFEKYRTEIFNLALSAVPFPEIQLAISDARLKAKTFIDKEVLILQSEYNAKLRVFDDLFTPLANELNALPAELQKINNLQLAAYLNDNLTMLYASVRTGLDAQMQKLYAVVSESVVISTSAKPIYYLPDKSGSNLPTSWEITEDSSKGKPLQIINPVDLGAAGFLQLDKKVNDLQTFVLRNANGNEFQRNAAQSITATLKDYTTALNNVRKGIETFVDLPIANLGIKVSINKWLNDATNYINTGSNISLNVRNAIIRVQEAVEKTMPVADFVRKLDPYFYYSEQGRLTNDIADIKRRFFDAMINIYGSDKSQTQGCDPDKPLISIVNEVRCLLLDYNVLTDQLITYINDPKNLATHGSGGLRSYFIDFNSKVSQRMGSIGKRAFEKINRELQSTEEYKQATGIYDRIKKSSDAIKGAESELLSLAQHYRNLLQQYSKDLTGQLDKQIEIFIDEKAGELIDAVGIENILLIQNDINEARNIYKLITSIKQQELTYDWRTTGFKDVNLGFVAFKKFSDPETKLTVAVKATIKFSAAKFPPAIDRIITYSENRFTNFGINFFNCITVGISEVSFIAGSDRSTHFDVKIKSVQFDGALSFVQAFEKWLQTLGTGLILQLENDHVALGYSLPIPSITSPAFSFFNLSLNFDLRLFFDSRPLLFGFSLATADRKFGISAFIYAGFGFFSIVVSPKRGIVEIDCALEAGAWAGISIGPISGEVKLAFGFRYTKNDSGVRIEGYIVAEGRLSVWILEVSARIYLGIVSANGVVEGECTVSYSVKLGFVSKSFSGTFHKRIAGSQSNNNGQQAAAVSANMQSFARMLVHSTSTPASKVLVDNHAAFFTQDFPAYLQSEEANWDIEETYAVSDEEWYQFINSYK